jgi:hypothetical protein
MSNLKNFYTIEYRKKNGIEVGKEVLEAYLAIPVDMEYLINTSSNS